MDHSSAPIKITGSVAVWLPQYVSPTELMEAAAKNDARRVIDMLMIYGPLTKESLGEMTRAGDAEITITLKPRDQQVAAATAALHKELEAVRSDFAQRQAEILERISKLSALEYVEAAQ